jgi:GT2 family glycosyltransferase
MSAIISTIIVNYNAGALLRNCVDSLLNCPLEIKIIVVDNASADDSLEALQDLPNIKIIKNSSNLGFAAACNIGMRDTISPFVLFLNPDCFFEPGTLCKLLDAMELDERVGMVGGLLINADGTEQQGARRAVPTPWRSFVRAFGLARFATICPRLFYDFNLHKEPLPDHPIEVEAISGACMLVRREVVQKVGEWDEGYFLHCEDLDWCMRFRQAGWKILFVPAAEIIHIAGVCGRNRPVFVEWNKHKGMVYFYRKFFRHRYPSILMNIVSAGVWIRFGFVVSYYWLRRVGLAIGFNRD